MRKCANILSYMRKPLVIYEFVLVPFQISQFFIQFKVLLTKYTFWNKLEHLLFFCSVDAPLMIYCLFCHRHFLSRQCWKRSGIVIFIRQILPWAGANLNGWTIIVVHWSITVKHSTPFIGKIFPTQNFSKYVKNLHPQYTLCDSEVWLTILSSLSKL